MSNRDALTILHEAKRGLSVPTQAEYNEAWREHKELLSKLGTVAKLLDDWQEAHDKGLALNVEAGIKRIREAIDG